MGVKLAQSPTSEGSGPTLSAVLYRHRKAHRELDSRMDDATARRDLVMSARRQTSSFHHQRIMVTRSVPRVLLAASKGEHVLLVKEEPILKR